MVKLRLQNKPSELSTMNIFKDISTASASRDLRKGVEIGKFSVIGDKNKAKYKVTKYNYLKLS